MRTLVSVIGLLGVMGGAASAEDNRTSPGTSTYSDGITVPHPAVVPVKLAVPPPVVVNSHTVFLNTCPNGCLVTKGNDDDSRTNTSGIVPHTGTLTALKATVDFASIKTCIKTALAPYNINVTDVDPGPTVDHFEIMIAGSPAEVGFDANFEGVASYLCGGAPGSCSGTYIPNSITFAFANAYGGITPAATALMCGVALQEVAHGWTLDHTTAATDPMTYKTYQTPLSFRDNAPCGSDCLYAGNKNAFGVQCAGSGDNATHVCMETGTATQNEVQVLTNLFGPAGAVAPTVAITSPADNAAEQTSRTFSINATCTSTDGAVKEIDLYTDDGFANTATASPATFMTAFTAGTHKIKVVCGTTKQASAEQTITVIVGSTCTEDADCGGTKICYQSSCIDGPGGAGGLGATCANNSDCASTMCGENGSTQACVIACDPSNSTCPAGFDCLDNGQGGGVCWIGGGSSGGCEAGKGGSPLSVLFGLGFAAMLITRRNRT